MLRNVILGCAFLALTWAQVPEEPEVAPTMCEMALLPRSEDFEKIYGNCSSVISEDFADSPEAMLCIATQMQFMDGDDLNEDAFVQYFSQRISENESGLNKRQKKKMIKRLSGKCKKVLRGSPENMLDALYCAADLKACRREEDSGEEGSEEEGSGEDSSEEEMAPTKCELALYPKVDDLENIKQNCSHVLDEENSITDMEEAMTCFAIELEFMDGDKFSEEKFIKYFTQRIQENDSGLRRRQKKKMIRRLTRKCRKTLQGNATNMFEALQCTADLKACRRGNE